MAQSSAVPINNNKTSTKPGGDRPLVPPDERFWQRYSPHYELPISGVSSFAVHAVVLGLAAVIATFGWFMLQENKPIPMETVELPGGSGANPKGIGNAPGDGALPENLPRDQQPKPPDKPPEQPSDLPPVNKSDGQAPPLPADPAGTRAIDDSGSTARLSGLQDAASKKLMASLAGKGEGGSGSGGGKGKGKGTGQGDGVGSGKDGNLNNRAKRLLRWTMIFDTRDGADYRSQLDAFGAIVCVPEANGKFRVVRDPKNEVKGDVTDLQRVFWWDTREESVRSLALAIGVKPVPTQIVAFFPVEFEEKLFRLERREMERRKGHWRETEIKETQFRVVRRGSTFEPVVADQTYER